MTGVMITKSCHAFEISTWDGYRNELRARQVENLNVHFPWWYIRLDYNFLLEHRCASALKFNIR